MFKLAFSSWKTCLTNFAFQTPTLPRLTNSLPQKIICNEFIPFINWKYFFKSFSVCLTFLPLLNPHVELIDEYVYLQEKRVY